MYNLLPTDIIFALKRLFDTSFTHAQSYATVKRGKLPKYNVASFLYKQPIIDIEFI